MFPITLYALFYLSPGTFRTPGDFSGTFKCGTQIDATCHRRYNPIAFAQELFWKEGVGMRVTAYG